MGMYAQTRFFSTELSPRRERQADLVRSLGLVAVQVDGRRRDRGVAQVVGKQWNGRPHPKRHRCAKVGSVL